MAELEEGLKKKEGEMRPRSIDEQDVMRDFEEECEEKVTREGSGDIYGKGKGKGIGGKGKHASRKGNGAAKMVNGDDEGEEADEEKEGTRKPRWAD